MPRGLRPPPKEWLREQTRAGRSQAEMAAEWGRRSGQTVSQPQVSAWCRRFGIFSARSAPSPRKVSAPERGWLEARLHLTLKEIAAEAGVSPPTVSRWLAELGLTRTCHGDPTHARMMALIAPDGSAEQAQAWLAARASTPAVEIAAELGVNDQVVYPLMREFGIAYRPVRRARTRGLGAVHERRAAGEVWAQRDCPRCPYLAACRVLERTGRRLWCETSGDVEYEQALEGKTRITA